MHTPLVQSHSQTCPEVTFHQACLDKVESDLRARWVPGLQSSVCSLILYRGLAFGLISR